jgi:hypothetical protein
MKNRISKIAMRAFLSLLFPVLAAHGADLVDSLLTQTWTNSAWANQSRQAYHYNASGNLDTATSQSWLTNAWTSSTRFLYTYNAGGKNDSLITQTYQTSAWNSLSLATHTFDANGNLIKSITNIWQTTSWLPFSIDSMAYNNAGKKTYDLIRQLNFLTQAMGNYTQTTDSYDGTGKDTAALTQKWNDTNSTWVNQQHSTYAYDGSGRQTSWVQQKWQASAWVNSNRYTTTYNAGGMISVFLMENWVASAWHNASQGNYTYNANGDNISVLTQNWSDSSNAWVNLALTTKTYKASNPILEARGQRMGSGLSLLPTLDGLQISYALAEPSQVELKIVNTQGREMLELAQGFFPGSTTPYTVSWNGLTRSGNRIPSGAYFLVLRAQGISGSNRLEAKAIPLAQ